MNWWFKNEGSDTKRHNMRYLFGTAFSQVHVKVYLKLESCRNTLRYLLAEKDIPAYNQYTAKS